MQNLLPEKFGQAASSASDSMKQQHDPTSGFPWWVRFLAKALGIIGGFVAMFFAILGLLTFSPRCAIASLLQLAAGFLTVALEAPFCCAFVDFIERIAQFSESRAYWQKAALYLIMGGIPWFICFELGTVLGTSLIIGAGLAYGFMALGKKADRDTMMGNLGGTNTQQDTTWSPQVNQPFPQPAGFNQP